MEFSWTAALITLGVWLAEAIVSISEGTFSRKQRQHMHMSFLWNWAVSIGDGVIFPVVNGLIWGQVSTLRWSLCASLITVGLVTSFAFHKEVWWGKDQNLGHVFISWAKSEGHQGWWNEDVTKAGWIHFVFMAAQVAIVGLYIFTPVDKITAVLVGMLLTIFLGIQNLQAIVVQRAAEPQKVANLCFLELVGVLLITLAKY